MREKLLLAGLVEMTSQYVASADSLIANESKATEEATEKLHTR